MISQNLAPIWFPHCPATTVIVICSWSELTCITMKHLVANTYLEQSWWIWNQEPWTVSDLDPTASCSDQTTLYSGKVVPETIGLRVTTQKAPSW